MTLLTCAIVRLLNKTYTKMARIKTERNYNH